MQDRFDGKAIIVTGASSGIGRSIAVELGRRGADLWLVGRSLEELEITSAHIVEAGGPTPSIAQIDLQQRGPLADLVETVASGHDHLFALINNAGVMHPEPIMQGTMARWEAMFGINVLAVLEGSQAAVTAMRAHARPAHIINIGSVQARFEVPGVYGITKQAVESIGVSLREELETDDIRVATIIPGGFVSQLARGFQPEQLATISANFAERGLALGGAGTDRVLSDPQHIANITVYILSQPIDLNIQEVILRPPVSTKA